MRQIPGSRKELLVTVLVVFDRYSSTHEVVRAAKGTLPEPVEVVVIHRGDWESDVPGATHVSHDKFEMSEGVDYKVVIDGRSRLAQDGRDSQLREAMRVIMFGLKHRNPRSIEAFLFNERGLQSLALV